MSPHQHLTPRLRCYHAQIEGTRGKQEDTAAWYDYPDGSGGCAIVADGIGGGGDGDKASKTVVAAFVQALEKYGNNLPAALTHANHALLRAKERHAVSDSRSCGSTLVAVSIVNGWLSYISVGDSNIFLHKKGTALGTHVNFHHSAGGSKITSAVTGYFELVGNPCQPNQKPFDYRENFARLEPGDRLILTSDGIDTFESQKGRYDRLSKLLLKYPVGGDADIQTIVSHILLVLEKRSSERLEMARMQQWTPQQIKLIQDNATILMVEAWEEEPQIPPGGEPEQWLAGCPPPPPPWDNEKTERTGGKHGVGGGQQGGEKGDPPPPPPPGEPEKKHLLLLGGAAAVAVMGMLLGGLLFSGGDAKTGASNETTGGGSSTAPTGVDAGNSAPTAVLPDNSADRVTRCEQLEREIDSLKSRNDDLETENAKLRAQAKASLLGKIHKAKSIDDLSLLWNELSADDTASKEAFNKKFVEFLKNVKNVDELNDFLAIGEGKFKENVKSKFEALVKGTQAADQLSEMYSFEQNHFCDEGKKAEIVKNEVLSLLKPENVQTLSVDFLKQIGEKKSEQLWKEIVDPYIRKQAKEAKDFWPLIPQGVQNAAWGVSEDKAPASWELLRFMSKLAAGKNDDLPKKDDNVWNGMGEDVGKLCGTRLAEIEARQAVDNAKTAFKEALKGTDAGELLTKYNELLTKYNEYLKDASAPKPEIDDAVKQWLKNKEGTSLDYDKYCSCAEKKVELFLSWSYDFVESKLPGDSVEVRELKSAILNGQKFKGVNGQFEDKIISHLYVTINDVFSDAKNEKQKTAWDNYVNDSKTEAIRKRYPKIIHILDAFIKSSSQGEAAQ